jgi:tRNA G10  N-methylase Trm11
MELSMATPQANRSFRDILIKALSDSVKTDRKGKLRFSATDFFDNWFRREGSAYYFLFRKNLKVTNIQFAELLALLKTYNKSEEIGAPLHNLDFVTEGEFKAAISELVEDFHYRSNDQPYDYESIANIYQSLFRRHVIIESFFGSCAVFTPPLVSINLEKLCAYSGYVHSCGRSIFIRKIDKATENAFFESLKRHLERFGLPDKRIFFSVYTHEDFSKYDRAYKEFLKDGLEDVKVYIEKFYLGDSRLMDILAMMTQDETLSQKLYVAPPGNYDEARGHFLEQSNADKERTIWLLIDYSIGIGINHRGRDRYYICYEQEYRNGNPFHIFDEDKPAWLAPTTIPHTLLGAMLNLASPGLSDRGENIILADPFVGTGTTWLEGLKFTNVDYMCGDLEDSALLLASDNLKFFSQSAAELERIKRALCHIARLPTEACEQSGNGQRSVMAEQRSFQKAYTRALDFLSELVKKQKGAELEDATVNDLSSISLGEEEVKALAAFPDILDRIFFYLLLRSYRKNKNALERTTADWEQVFKREAGDLIDRISSLSGWKKVEPEIIRRDGTLAVFISRYSKSISIDPQRLSTLAESGAGAKAIKPSWNVIDEIVSNRLAPNSCHLIVTDPPYGFNTEEGVRSLASLYREALEVMIKALKDNGQLVLCLPDQSHSGHHLKYFTQKEIVIQQVLSIAEELNREVVIHAYKVAEPTGLFRPPFYWESEKALRRAIIHFRFGASQSRDVSSYGGRCDKSAGSPQVG